MSPRVGLLSLATASPPHALPQAVVADVARQMFEHRFAGYQRMAQVFDTAGVRTRQAVRPLDWYLAPRDWRERSDAYLDGAVELFSQAAQGALEQAGRKGAEVDVVVTVSSTGIATPSLEARAASRLGFRPDVVRVPVFGLGCAGGASGLALAARLAAVQPGAVVLFVAVELCSLAFRPDELTKANIVATALFGDGAAAAVLQSGAPGFADVEGYGEHTWPDTLDIMGWRVDPEGLGVIFARAIPPFARAHLRPAMDLILERQGLGAGDVGRFVCHPGGVKVIEALEGALEIGQGSLAEERQVLAEHGNMSAPTVLFVLDRVRRQGLPERSTVNALGPGFTASSVTLRRAA